MGLLTVEASRATLAQPRQTVGSQTSASTAALCLLCGGAVERWNHTRGHWIVQCSGCGHRQAEVLSTPALQAAAHVEENYGDDYFTGGGIGYTDYHCEAPLLRQRGARYGQILARHAVPGRLLDVGAAAGYFLDGYRQAGWTGIGIEPNDTMAAHARARGVDVRTGLADEATLLGADIAEGSLDAVAMVQVIAHVLDPVDALTALSRRLRPGGLFLVETWDRGSKTARALGLRWHEYSPPSVVHWFRRNELDTTMRRIGLTPVAHGRMAKWINAHHAASLLAASSPSGVVTKAARLVPGSVNFPYPAEDLFWAVYQRNANG
jgi:SAM-dependent methyltransferase